MYRQEYDTVLLAVGSTVARDMQTAAGFGARPGWGMVQREPYIYIIFVFVFIFILMFMIMFILIFIFLSIFIL
jgi:hypothetical protein